MREDEWTELRDSYLGVFIKFHELNFGWSSRPVHHMLGLQLVCEKKHEIWCLIGVKPVRFSLNEFAELTGLNCNYVENLEYPEVEVTDEISAFWELLGVEIEQGPSHQELLEACENCEDWSREDRIRLGYLAIFAGFIDAHSHTQGCNLLLSRMVMDLERFVDYPWGRVTFAKLITSVKETDLTKAAYTINGFIQALQAWVFFAMPDFASEYGRPHAGSLTPPPLLAYGGAKGRKSFKGGMLKQTNFSSFIWKADVEEMFPRWDDDGEDVRVVNIVKAMFGLLSKKEWKWNKSHWPTLGVLQSNNKEKLKAVKEEQGQGTKRELEVIDEGSKKKARVDDLEMRLTDAVKGAVLVGLIDISMKMDSLSKRVEEMAAAVEEIKKEVSLKRKKRRRRKRK